MSRMKHWQTWEDNYITKNWGRLTQIEMAVRLDCTRDQVRARLYQIGAVRHVPTETPKVWTKSYLTAETSIELLLAVNIQRILRGTYR